MNKSITMLFKSNLKTIYMMKIALLLNQSHSSGTALKKVSFLIYNLAFLLENVFFNLQITTCLTLLTFFSDTEACMRWGEEDTTL